MQEHQHVVCLRSPISTDLVSVKPEPSVTLKLNRDESPTEFIIELRASTSLLNLYIDANQGRDQIFQRQGVRVQRRLHHALPAVVLECC